MLTETFNARNPLKSEVVAINYGAVVSEVHVKTPIGIVISEVPSSLLEEFDIEIGINWYLNNNVKRVLRYEQTDFDSGGDGTDGRPLG